MTVELSGTSRSEDWALWAARSRSLVAASVADGDRGFTALFEDMDLPAPTVIVDPEQIDLELPASRRLAAWYQALERDPDMPHPKHLAPERLRGFLGSLAITEPCESSPGNFRFRLYGSDIAAHSSVDLTRRTLFDLPAQAPVPPGIPIFFAALNQMALATGKTIYSRHRPPETISALMWNRLALPFSDGHGTDRVLVQLIPVSTENPLPSS